MTFQQRNGRVDRYGQTKQPLIRYLQTLPQDETLDSFGDAHIIELLIEKDNNAQKNIDDPREFCGTKEEQEAITVAKVQDEEPLDLISTIRSRDSPLGRWKLPTMPPLKNRRLKNAI